MTTYTNITKPSGTSYTNQNGVGKEQYDQATLTYDDISTYYDGINLLAYTKVSTPTIAWNLARASFSQAYSIVAQSISPEFAFFSPDGLRMYLGDGNTGNTIIQFSLSTAWDLSTRAVVQTEVVPSVTYIEAMFFKPDGLKMYLVDGTPDTVREYDLSTAWDISTSTFLQLFDTTAQDSAPTGMYFNPDGTKLFLTGDTGAEVNEYNLLLPWNVSTCVFNQTKSISAQTTTPDGIFFKYDGLKLYITSYSNPGKVLEYNLVEPWNISTLSFLQSITTVAANFDTFSLFFRGDGLRMFVMSSSTASVREYLFTQTYTNVAKPS